MENLIKHIPSIRTLFSVAAFCGLIVYGLRDTILSIAHIGSDELSLVLAFFLFTFVGILGTAGFYAISNREIDSETATRLENSKNEVELKEAWKEIELKKLEMQANKDNVAIAKNSENVWGEQEGEGGYIDVEGSSDVVFNQVKKNDVESSERRR